MPFQITRRMKVLAFVLGSFLTAIEYWNHRMVELEHLYSTSISPSSERPTAEAAVRKLNTYAGSEPKKFLLKLATADRDFLDNRQDLAIRLLMTRGDPSLTIRLVALLQPSVGLARRESVAEALQNTTCDIECTRFVLHYIERRWSANAIREDITNAVVHFEIDPKIEKEQLQVVQQLEKTLAINAQSTIHVLRDTYGLGSPVPSSFSLEVLNSVHLKEACPFLVASEHKLMDSSKASQLERAIREIGCTDSP